MTDKIIPRVTDNDKDSITVTINDRELRQWSYRNDEERRRKMGFAREYIEGWCDHRDSMLKEDAMGKES